VLMERPADPISALGHILLAKEARVVAALRPPFVVEPAAAHDSTVIMLHGMYSDGSMFEALPALVAHYAGARAGGTRFIFANAPLRDIDWPKGKEHGVSAWYNYFTANSGTAFDDVIDEAHLAQVTDAVHELIATEVAALGGDATRVAIGGNSQGGTVACHAAMTFPGGPLGALVLGCTNLMGYTTVDASKSRLPVFVFVAEKDEEYPPTFQKECFGRLRAAGFEVRSHVEPGLSHYTDSMAELHYRAAWVSETLHGQPVHVSFRDHPDAPPVQAATLFEL